MTETFTLLELVERMLQEQLSPEMRAELVAMQQQLERQIEDMELYAAEMEAA